MTKSNKINNNTLGLLIGLVAGIFWIFMGLDIGFKFEAPDTISYILTLCGQRHTIVTILALILIPICAREIKWGFIAAMVLGIITCSLSLIHCIYMIIAATPGYESQIFGPIVWAVIQVPIILFAYKARKKLNNTTAIK